MFEIADMRKQESSKPNLTGIPDATKQNFENASGLSFDDVRIHYNSDKPAQLQALAYTQGNQVYIGPGQEKHLGHELGHVVQQKFGIVKPDKILNGISINDNINLERDADNYSNMTFRTDATRHCSYSTAIQMQKITFNEEEYTVIKLLRAGARERPYLVDKGGVKYVIKLGKKGHEGSEAAIDAEATIMNRLKDGDTGPVSNYIKILSQGTGTFDTQEIEGDDEYDGAAAILMEYAEGESIDRLAKVDATGDIKDLFDQSKQKKIIAVGIIDGLIHMHSKGVMHGDLDTKNVFIGKTGSDLVAKIADFGESSIASGNLTQDNKDKSKDIANACGVIRDLSIQENITQLATALNIKAFAYRNGTDLCSFAQLTEKLMEIKTACLPTL
jgi:serine/threonine protein kinase